ncbi:MAG: histidine phosphatase family protein [Gluconacetobacter diazotrophicus]|nr:histidine phosphatase family protein [Gluconacetobacter diazotrophicus]
MILLRHGQSEFNAHFTLHRRDPGIEDPSLTAIGEEQARAAAGAIAAGHRVTRIIASPFRRALQTAAPAAALFGLPVSVSPSVRERYAFRCDIGSPPANLAADWPRHDFAALPERWWLEHEPDPDGTLPIEPEAAVIRRANAFRAAMRDDPEQATTLVVSHWGFLLCLSGRSLENGSWIELDPTLPLDGPISWQH